MTTGIYKTTDPNLRVKIVFDKEYPTENPDFPYAEGVLDDLIKCYEEGDYYGVILLKREVWRKVTDDFREFEEREEWAEEDSIWGCAGYENPAVDIAKEYFNVSVTEKI